MNEYEYVEKLEESELIQIIEDMLDFEEVAKAFLVLVDCIRC